MAAAFSCGACTGGGSSSVTYLSGIASEAAHASRADKAKKAEVAEQANVANRASSAQTANYASKAGEVDIESETLQKFLRKDDPAEGKENVAEEVHRKVDFKKAATFEEAADMLKKFTAHELAAFLKGFTIAGQFGIDEYGDMILNTIKSLEYNNAAEQGFSIEKEDPNRDEYHQYITNLTVWGKMTMNELEVMKRTYAGGTIYLSPAGGKIAKVVPVSSWDDDESEWHETSEDMCVGWKCYLLADDGTAATENLWREGDQVRCQTMGRIAAGGIGQGSAANKSYWRTILKHGVSRQNEKIYDHKMDHELFGGQRFAWIVIGKHSVQLDEYAEENAPAETRDIPEEGDVIVLDGSRTDPDRQNVFLLESHGSYAPRLVGYHGIDSYSHANKDVCDVSPKGVQVRSEYFKLLAQGSNTSTVEIPNFRGAWNAATQYYKNDQVSHNNAIWTCIKDADFQKEPTDDSTYWRKEVYGQKGEDGSSFKVLGTAVKHFTNADDIGGELLTTKEYLFDDTSGLPDGVASPCIATYMKVGAGHLWIICKSNEGDSYMIGDDLWTNSGTAWLNIGNVKGVSISSTSVTYGVSASGTQEPSSWSSVIPPTTDEYPYLWTRTVVNYTDGKSTTSFSVSHNGKDGENGKVGVLFSVGSTWIFDADSDGLVPSDTKKTATIYVTRNGKGVKIANAASSIGRSQNIVIVDGKNLPMTVKDNVVSITLSGENIRKQQVGDRESNVVSVTSGYLCVFISTEDGDAGIVNVPFQVNVAKYTGELTLTNEQFRVSMDGLTTRMEAAEGGITNVNARINTEVDALHSEITSTANDIKLEVTEQMNGNLKKAGLEVKADGITLYGDKITITNDDGKTTTALFTGGKINASLIDADKIEVKHLWAKSNDGASKVGYFGNTEEEACKIDDTYAPLFVGADTAKNSPFYVTNKGHMVSKSATLGSFSLNESSLRYLTGYDDEEPGFALYNEYMVFRGYSRTFSPQTQKWTSERNRLIWVGRNDWVYSVPSLMSNILVQDSFPMATDDTAKIGLRISVTGCDDKYQYENVMYNGAMGSNVYGNFAIYAENGMYAGFRPMTRRANYSMKLTELDCVIYVPVTGITLTLPDNPQRGQCYKFIQGSGDFYIKSSSKNIYSNGGQTDKFRSGAYNQTTEIIWLDDHWRINWFREIVGK